MAKRKCLVIDEEEAQGPRSTPDEEISILRFKISRIEGKEDDRPHYLLATGQHVRIVVQFVHFRCILTFKVQRSRTNNPTILDLRIMKIKCVSTKHERVPFVSMVLVSIVQNLAHPLLLLQPFTISEIRLLFGTFADEKKISVLFR